MFIRINIPCWGPREVLYGLRAILGSPSGVAFRRRLRKELEAEVAGRRVLLFCSARQALAESVRHLGLVDGRIAVPGYVCPAVVSALRSVTSRIVPIDCEPDSVWFDKEALRGAVAQGQVDGIVAPSTHGVGQDLAFLMAFGLPVIEDAAYQAGYCSKVGSQQYGLRGTIGIWSFNFKSLAGVGGGALLVTTPASDPIARACDWWIGTRRSELVRFINYALRAVGRHHIPRFLPGACPPRAAEVGRVRPQLMDLGDVPMSELQGAVALAQWESRRSIQARQAQSCRSIESLLPQFSSLRRLRHCEYATLVHLYPLLMDEKRPSRRLTPARIAMHDAGVQTEDAYPVLLGSKGMLPQSHLLSSRLLLVPCHASLGRREMGHIQRVLESIDRQRPSET